MNEIDEYGEYGMNHKIQMKIVLEDMSQLFYIKPEDLVVGTVYTVYGNTPTLSGAFSEVKGEFIGYGRTTSGPSIILNEATLLYVDETAFDAPRYFPTQSIKERYLRNIRNWFVYSVTINDNLKIRK
jgi:hypothetical protein